MAHRWLLLKQLWIGQLVLVDNNVIFYFVFSLTKIIPQRITTILYWNYYAAQQAVTETCCANIRVYSLNVCSSFANIYNYIWVFNHPSCINIKGPYNARQSELAVQQDAVWFQCILSLFQLIPSYLHSPVSREHPINIHTVATIGNKCALQLATFSLQLPHVMNINLKKLFFNEQ